MVPRAASSTHAADGAGSHREAQVRSRWRADVERGRRLRIDPRRPPDRRAEAVDEAWGRHDSGAPAALITGGVHPIRSLSRTVRGTTVVVSPGVRVGTRCLAAGRAEADGRPGLSNNVLRYEVMRATTSYFVTDVRRPGVSPAGIALRAASPVA